MNGVVIRVRHAHPRVRHVAGLHRLRERAASGQMGIDDPLAELALHRLEAFVVRDRPVPIGAERDDPRGEAPR